MIGLAGCGLESFKQHIPELESSQRNAKEWATPVYPNAFIPFPLPTPAPDHCSPSDHITSLQSLAQI